MNYTLHSIRIKSSWFDNLERQKNVYQKITYKGLNLYFQLYKFGCIIKKMNIRLSHLFHFCAKKQVTQHRKYLSC